MSWIRKYLKKKEEKKKKDFPKFQLIPLLRLQIMHDYVHCSIIDYCGKLIIVDENLCEYCYIEPLELIGSCCTTI